MTVAARATGIDSIGRRILLSLQLLDRVQHWDGEIVSYRNDGHGNHVYCRTPLPSAYVHDALELFGSDVPGWIDGVLDVVPGAGPARVRAYRDPDPPADPRVSELATGARRLVAGLGRGSGMDPDVNTTALATLALRESYGPHSASRWERQIRVLLAFRSPSGPFDTFRKPGGDAYGWLDDAGRTVAGFDPVVNTAVLDSLCALSGRDDAVVSQLVGYLLSEVLTGDIGQRGTVLYPNPLVLPHGVAHAGPGTTCRTATG